MAAFRSYLFGRPRRSRKVGTSNFAAVSLIVRLKKKSQKITRMQCKKHNCKGLVASASNFSQTVFLSHSRGPNRFARDAEIQHFPAMPTAPEFSAFIVRAGAKGKHDDNGFKENRLLTSTWTKGRHRARDRKVNWVLFKSRLRSKVCFFFLLVSFRLLEWGMGNTV